VASFILLKTLTSETIFNPVIVYIIKYATSANAIDLKKKSSLVNHYGLELIKEFCYSMLEIHTHTYNVHTYIHVYMDKINYNK